MLETDHGRVSWKRDLVVLLAWAFWLFFFSSLEAPSWLRVSGTAFVLVYGAWSWPFKRAAFILLIVAWVYSSISLTLSGMYWVALMIVYVILKAAQFRFLVRNAFQFAVAVFMSAMALELTQLIIIHQMYSTEFWVWTLMLGLALSSLAHSLIAFFFFGPMLKLVGVK